MVPVGGGSTIGAKEARVLVNQIKPAIAIPMHYKTKFCRMDIQRIYEFSGCIDYFRLYPPTIKLSALSLPRKTEVWVLEPRGYDTPPS